MRVATENHVNPAHAPSELDINGHDLVQQQADCTYAFAAHLIYHFRQLGFLYAESPLRHKMPRIRNRRVRKRLPYDRYRYTIQFTQRIGLEHRIAKVSRLDVLREKLDSAQ